MRALTLKSCQTWLVDIPLQRRHHMAFGAPAAVNFTLVKLLTEDGLTGWGEAATLGGPGWSAESAETIKLIIDRYLAPRLVGQSLLDYQHVLHSAYAPVRDNHFAKAALEFAVMDLAGQYYQQPLYRLLGGAYRQAIDLSWSLASGDTATDIAEAEQKIAAGHRIFKLKFGADSWQNDLRRLAQIRAALGPEISLRVDVNQGWDRTTARQALREIAPYNPEFLEQPLPAWDIAGLAELKTHSPIPILADESFTGPHAALDLIKQQAVDAVSFKMTKLGGIVPALQTHTLIRTAGLASYIGCMIETGIGTAAYLQFAAAVPQLEYGCELFGPLLLQNDVLETPIHYQSGQVVIPQGYGLGIRVDESKVCALARQ